MSSAAGSPSNGTSKAGVRPPDSRSSNKGKGKSAVASPDVSMEDDEEEEEDDDEDEDEDDEDDDEDEAEDVPMDDVKEKEANGDNVIDPSRILPRRTRGVKVDYTSQAALEKAGLQAEGDNDDD